MSPGFGASILMMISTSMPSRTSRSRRPACGEYQLPQFGAGGCTAIVVAVTRRACRSGHRPTDWWFANRTRAIRDTESPRACCRTSLSPRIRSTLRSSCCLGGHTDPVAASVATSFRLALRVTTTKSGRSTVLQRLLTVCIGGLPHWDVAFRGSKEARRYVTYPQGS